jgi:hypothetical protein
MVKLSKYVRRINLPPFITFTCTDDYRLAELICAVANSIIGIKDNLVKGVAA